MAITTTRCYAINRSTNTVYYSDDYGTTWSQFTSTGLSTTSASDIDVNPIIFNNMMVLNGATSSSTPYLSIDGGATFAPGANIAGKEIHYVSSSGIVVGGKRLKTNTGPTLYISTNGGVSFTESINTTSLFSYPGAVYSNITVMDVDFTTPYGGYIAIAGNQDNSSADSLLTRTYDSGNTFPDTVILPGSQYGVIRCVFGNPYGKVVFAAGEPGLTNRGKLYIIDKALTDIPVEVLSGITAGDSTNTTITKFFTLPNKDRNIVFFIDSDGSLYKSTDGGETWTFKSDVPGNCVDILAANESIIIALTNSPSAIYKSVDSGSTWTEVLQPSWTNAEALAYNELASCESCPSGYTVERSGFAADDPIYCSSYNYMGPLCKPPYQYLAIDKTCVSPSTVVPSNIVYLIDKSGSVDTDETEKIGLLLRKLTLELSDRLATGSIEIAVVTFATGVCTHLEFTSDQDLIISKVLNLVECYTPFQNNHILGFCTATRLLYEKSIQRPNAKNTMILLTDGSHYGVQGICDLSDIGLQPIVNSNTDRPWLELAADVKANLAGVGMDMFCVVYGSLGERNQMYRNYIQDPINNNYEPLPTRTPRGNYYYFDISNNDLSFTDTLAQQIRLGLSSDTFLASNCPDGCTSVPGIDNLGYCECPDRIDVVPCLYKFTDCSGIIPPFYYYNSLFAINDGKTVRLGNPSPSTIYYQPGCFTITSVLPADIPAVPVDQIINPLGIQILQGAVFDDCPSCTNYEYYKFTDCTNPNRFIYSADTGLDFKLAIGPVWKSQLSGYRNTCWRGEFIGAIDPPPAEAITGWRQGLAPIVIGSNPSQTCPDCTGPVDVTSYKFTDCQTTLPPVYTENDFSSHAGKIVKLLQYPDVCWNVSVNTDQNFTVENLTIDGVSFLSCLECLPVAPTITYTLTSCDPPFTNQIATDSNLEQYVGGTVRLTTTGDTCWNVTSGSLPNLVLQPVSISQSFISCQDCYPQIYSFTDCQNPNNKIYTLIDFSAYQGQYLRLQEYPGICWICGVTDDRTLPRQDVTIFGNPYGSCPECTVSYYQLTNCANENVYLISATDLSRYINRVITAAGYPGLCFTVTEPKCECIKITVNDVDYNVSAQPNLFNGRYSYTFITELGDTLSLAWNINPDRWELFNSSTLEIYGFSTTNNECPFSNFWTIQQGSSYIITRVTFCPEDIYAISPELDFADCLPCIKCI